MILPRSKHAILLLIVLNFSVFGCSLRCHNIADSDCNVESRRDKDLTGITFYVYGVFPEEVAGYRILEGSYRSVEKLIERHNGNIATEFQDMSIDVVIFGSIGSPSLQGAFDRDLIENENRQVNIMLTHFVSNNIEVIDVEVLLSRLSKGEYFDPANASPRTGVWDD